MQDKRLYQTIKKVVESKGYKFFTGEMDINLIGVRQSDHLTNKFDDKLYVLMVMDGEPRIFAFKNFTTDPGSYYLKTKLLNEKGCAILKPGQYRGMWKEGLHRGKYPALVQCGKCTVYRDGNKDDCIDVNVEDEGYFGINMHHGYDNENVNRNSAGCQVHSRISQHEAVMNLYRKSAAVYGEKVTYTLLEEEDFYI